MKSFPMLYEKAKSWCRNLLKDEKRRINALVALGAAGLLLLAFSEWLPQETTAVSNDTANLLPADQQNYAQQLEARLQAMIVQVEGAGKAEVMVTLQSGEESVYATDQNTSADGSVSVSHVLVANEGLLETTQTPQILGVAVVCEGGDKAAVQSRICSMVQALTGVGSNHITVTKMAADATN